VSQWQDLVNKEGEKTRQPFLTAVYRTPDIARYYEDFHPISRLWTGNECKFSDDIFQTNGYFIYLNGFYISRSIFVSLKDIKVLMVFVKMNKLPLNDPLLTRKYWPRYCRIVKNYYITNLKKMNHAFFFIHNLSMLCPNLCESTKRYRPKKDTRKCTEYCKIAQLKLTMYFKTE
jgi:hypothetical protein